MNTATFPGIARVTMPAKTLKTPWIASHARLRIAAPSAARMDSGDKAMLVVPVLARPFTSGAGFSAPLPAPVSRDP